jgi:hypothetical protein
MPIVTSDILFKYSTLVGSAGNSNVGSAATSLGKYISTTQITDATLNNLFDNVTGDENAASDIEYRCFFVHNAHASLTLLSPVAWISAEVAGGASLALSVDTTAASAVGSAASQAKQVADESTAPSSQTFSAPTSKGAGLALGDIGPGQVRAIWVRRTAANTSALNSDGATFRVEGDTNA